MTKGRHKHLRKQGFLMTLPAVLMLAGEAQASQALDGDTWVEEHVDEAPQSLTAQEVRQALAALQGDVTASMRLARVQRVRTVSVERHEEDKNAPPDRRRADVVLYNYDTNETISAVVTLGQTPVIDELAIIPDQPAGVGTQEVEEARQLALASPDVRAALRAAGFGGRERGLIITHIRVQAAGADDPCSTDRCVVLFFNTRDAVLDVEPLVNLTTRQVELQ